MASSFIFGQNASPLNDVSVEQQLCWTAGAALMRTQSAGSTCQRHFLRGDLAIGVLFQNPGSEVNWRLDGKLALDKAWTNSTISHEMVILPPGCEFGAQCRGSGQGLWLFVDPELVAREQRLEALAKEPRVDGSWVKDRLAWTIFRKSGRNARTAFRGGLCSSKAPLASLLPNWALRCTASRRGASRAARFPMRNWRW